MAEQMRTSRVRKVAVFRETALENKYDAIISRRLTIRLTNQIGVSSFQVGLKYETCQRGDE